LGGNTALDWSNPRWQRFLAIGFSILTLAMVCKLLSFAAVWLMYGGAKGYYDLGVQSYVFTARLVDYANDAYPIVCGVGLWYLTKGERRYPDMLRAERILALSLGTLLFAIGVVAVAVHHGNWLARSSSVHVFLSYAQNGLWIPFALSILTCTVAMILAKRSGSRLLSSLAQAPLYPAAATIVFWAMLINRLWWGFRSLLADAAFPLTMIAMLVVMIHVLLAGAREATQNWVTDP
jgi:hypothetical protein